MEKMPDCLQITSLFLLSEKTGKKVEHGIVNPELRSLWKKCQFSQIRSVVSRLCIQGLCLILSFVIIFIGMSMVMLKRLYKLKPIYNKS